MRLNYLILRLIRHFMPESIARFLLKRRWVIKPGLESTDPAAASARYIETLVESGISIKGKRVLVFGYGGRFAVGVDLLQQGAAHVVLCDHFVLLDHERNQELLPAFAQYLMAKPNEVLPDPEFITLLHGDIRSAAIQQQIAQVDVVLSNSVFEHLGDVPGITSALSKLTAPKGAHLHFVDLRDHYFKYPFEMLKYSEWAWKNFLNPTSHLNRYRLGDYRRVFGENFKQVEITVLKHLPEEFRQAEADILPAFKTGDLAVDDVGLIQVFAVKLN